MKVVRIVVGVVVGYLVYAVGSMLLAGHAIAGGGAIVVVLVLLGLAAIGAVAGLAAGRIGEEGGRTAATVAAALVALATGLNLALSLGAEPTWYKVGTLLLTVPLVGLVGRRMAP